MMHVAVMASRLTLEEGVEVDAVGQLRHPLHLLWSTDSQAGRQAYERVVYSQEGAMRTGC